MTGRSFIIEVEKNMIKREILEMEFFMDRKNFDDYFDGSCVMEMIK
jgi:hypothetical protein